jgi:hypothetical protein
MIVRSTLTVRATWSLLTSHCSALRLSCLAAPLPPGEPKAVSHHEMGRVGPESPSEGWLRPVWDGVAPRTSVLHDGTAPISVTRAGPLQPTPRHPSDASHPLHDQAKASASFGLLRQGWHWMQGQPCNPSRSFCLREAVADNWLRAFSTLTGPELDKKVLPCLLGSCAMVGGDGEAQVQVCCDVCRRTPHSPSTLPFTARKRGS